jgi:hypothetical protein
MYLLPAGELVRYRLRYTNRTVEPADYLQPFVMYLVHAVLRRPVMRKKNGKKVVDHEIDPYTVAVCIKDR